MYRLRLLPSIVPSGLKGFLFLRSFPLASIIWLNISQIMGGRLAIPFGELFLIRNGHLFGGFIIWPLILWPNLPPNRWER